MAKSLLKTPAITCSSLRALSTSSLVHQLHQGSSEQHTQAATPVSSTSTLTHTYNFLDDYSAELKDFEGEENKVVTLDHSYSFLDEVTDLEEDLFLKSTGEKILKEPPIYTYSFLDDTATEKEDFLSSMEKKAFCDSPDHTYNFLDDSSTEKEDFLAGLEKKTSPIVHTYGFLDDMTEEDQDFLDKMGTSVTIDHSYSFLDEVTDLESELYVKSTGQKVQKEAATYSYTSKLIDDPPTYNKVMYEDCN